MNILGINPGWHDSSATLLQDGKLVRLIETDRVSRVKQAMHQDPALSWELLFKEEGITLDDIDIVAMGWDLPKVDELYGRKFNYEKKKNDLFPRDRFPRKKEPEIIYMPHHESHAASGIYTSGFKDSAILVVDGKGECQSTSIFKGTQAGVELIQEWPIDQSLGDFYGYGAEWAGFGFWGPGKLMGLAPYASPDKNDIIELKKNGYSFKGDYEGDPGDIDHQNWYHWVRTNEWHKAQYPFNTGTPGDIMAHARIAATVQNAFEQAMFHLAKIAKRKTGINRLVIAGGAGLNCSFNGKLSAAELFEDLYIPPVPHDAGVGLGAALLAYRKLNPKAKINAQLPHAYYGFEPKSDAINEAAFRTGLPTREFKEGELEKYVAQLLTQGNIVGWFQGRAEIGQRALGARSMLADPRDRKTLTRVNEVKGREIWRPLAPSLLEEHAGDYFNAPISSMTKFMLAAMSVKRSAWEKIPACVHIDGSSRPQIVSKKTNPRYWSLINEFYQLTGIPVIMNTSFNLASEPIVNKPEDAVRSFLRSKMDALVLNNIVVQKPIQ